MTTPCAAPFAAPVFEVVPRDWLAALPGQLRVGVLLELEAGDAPQRGEAALTQMSAEVEDKVANAS